LLAFCEAVGRPDLAQQHGPPLRAELERVFASRTLAEWTDDLAEVDTCFAPVNTLDEAVADPQAAALGLFPTVYGLPQIGLPIAFSETPARYDRPPPGLGEHTREVLAEVGIRPSELAELAKRGVV
jgi:crotonobetainyl-CoA:carnitine CoA-transferase CaiB-like acyl-CoA transferase